MRPSALSPLLVLLAACSAEPAAPPAPAPSAGAEVREVRPSETYALATCVVSGDKLGPVADRTAVVWEGTEVQLCCPMCIDEFRKDPAKFAAAARAGGR